MERHADEGQPSAVRSRLLSTAIKVFYQEGIHSVGIDRIVTTAQVTRATLYRHFPGKEDLVLAYLDQVDQVSGVRRATLPRVGCRRPTPSGPSADPSPRASSHRASADAPSSTPSPSTPIPSTRCTGPSSPIASGSWTPSPSC